MERPTKVSWARRLVQNVRLNEMECELIDNEI